MESPYTHPPPPPSAPGPHYSMQQGPPPHDHSYRPQPYGALPQTSQYQYLPPPHMKSEGPGSDNGIIAQVPGPAGPEPQPYSAEVIHEGRKYALEVVQQPQRARMCGFGDKDRRPITPPPCIRLVITDLSDGKEVDINGVDHGFYVLNVDMWSEDGQREVNLVRHTSHQPGSYSQGGSVEPNTPAYASSPIAVPGVSRDPYQSYGYGQGPPNGANSQPSSSYNGYPHPQAAYPPPPAPAYGQHTGYPPRPASPGYNGRGYPDPRDQYGYQGRPADPYQDPQRMAVAPVQQPPAGGMYTRNLIGSLSASAFRLTDSHGKIGVWFVLQDLSVRTEGSFRLRFSFVNVGATASNGSTPTNSGGVNTGRAPILASCYSDVFTVYSAKKFPGVVESTDLSKMFASQGIKIPIRKEGPGNKSKDDFEADE